MRLARPSQPPRLLLTLSFESNQLHLRSFKGGCRFRSEKIRRRNETVTQGHGSFVLHVLASEIWIAFNLGFLCWMVRANGANDRGDLKVYSRKERVRAVYMQQLLGHVRASSRMAEE